MDVVSRDSKLKMALVHSAEIPVNSVSHHSFINSLVSLSAFKALNTIVESRVLGHKLERHVRHNHGSLPATVLTVVVNLEHVVGSNASKRVLVVCWWLRLENFALLNDKIASHECLFVGGCG